MTTTCTGLTYCKGELRNQGCYNGSRSHRKFSSLQGLEPRRQTRLNLDIFDVCAQIFKLDRLYLRISEDESMGLINHIDT